MSIFFGHFYPLLKAGLALLRPDEFAALLQNTFDTFHMILFDLYVRYTTYNYLLYN